MFPPTTAAKIKLSVGRAIYTTTMTKVMTVNYFSV